MPNKHQKNNKGFSLIELLVAITILAVVMIPMLHSFITSARANAKARKVMEATTAAQNLMEEMKSENLPKYLTDKGFSKVPVMKDEDSGEQYKDVDGNGIVGYYKAFDSSESSALTVNDREFRAKVTLDPHNYMTLEGESLKNTDYNAIPFAKLSKLSKASNAFYIQKSDQEDLASKSMNPAAYVEVYNQMRRTITIDIEHDSSTKVTKVYVTVNYKDERAGESGEVTPINRQEIYSNADDPEKKILSNVFVCFFPIYNNADVANPKEEIVINNKNNCRVGVYLVKQTARDDNPQYAANKNHYMVNLTINEGNRDSGDDSFMKLDAGGNPTSEYNVITAVATNLDLSGLPTMKELKVNYSQTGTLGIPIGDVTKLINIKDLSKSEADTRIYDVTIKVYDKKDDSYEKVLTTMEGTTIQ